jgi:hypothetical protein
MLTKTQIRQLLSNWDIDTKLEIGKLKRLNLNHKE